MPIFRGKTAVSSYSDRKDSVRLASSVNINLSSSNVTTIDGAALTHLDRILLFSQTSAQQNGIYVYRLGTRLSRAEDADQGSELTPGSKVFVEEGVLNNQSDFVLSNIGTVTIGVTPLVFTKTGEVIELTNDGTYGSASQNVVLTTNKSGQITAVTQTPILIGNANLLNSSITINGGSVPLGDEIILNTDDFQEGFSQYYTDDKVRAAIGVSGDLSYDSSTGIISYTAGETLPTQTGNTGKYLTTDGTTASWAQVDFASTLNQLTDVDTTGADNNYTLVYNTNSNTWLTSLSIANGTVIDGGNLDGPSGGSGVTTISDVHNIDELADVVVTNPTIDQVLKWNGSAWVNAANATAQAWSIASTTYDATAGSKTFVNTTTNAVQVNLPASPLMGDEVTVVDANGNAATNNITIARNGEAIAGAGENFIIDINDSSITFTYYNSTRGWIITRLV